MSRQAGIDAPCALHHVIARGIERRDIFEDDDDRHLFVQRLSSLLDSTSTSCLAWSLIPNHFHLLIRTSDVKLATFMRRLLTGYAVIFNLRHNRSGHLFQNRYKSIICQEDEYLLELVRYIHLNPVRAGIVSGLEKLDRYPWCGHAILMGKQEMKGQDTKSVLRLFGTAVPKARRGYKAFVADGISQGRRNDLVGRLPEVGSRILGDEEFAEEIRIRETVADRIEARTPIAVIANNTAAIFGIPVRAISAGGRREATVKARSMVCFQALEEGYSVTHIARYLGMSRNGVMIAAGRHQ
jgi:putative transposase